MTKIIGFVALVVSFALPCFAADKSGPITENMAGTLIDEMMKKNASDVITAESALPTLKPKPSHQENRQESGQQDKNQDIKNIEATQPVFNNPTSASTVTKTEGKNLWGRMVGSLAIVLLIFGGGVFAYRRWPGSQKMAQRAKMIEVLSQQYLGPKRSLAVVRVAGEAVLIGITDSNITLLKPLSLLDDDLPTETREARYTLKTNENQKFKATLGTKVKDEVSSREDEFSMQGLKEIIGDRLKNMREI